MESFAGLGKAAEADKADKPDKAHKPAEAACWAEIIPIVFLSLHSQQILHILQTLQILHILQTLQNSPNQAKRLWIQAHQ